MALSTKSLPQERSKPEEFEYGFQESAIILTGKCSLRDALTFMTLHYENSAEYTAEKIALNHKLNKEVVGKYTHLEIIILQFVVYSDGRSNLNFETIDRFCTTTSHA